MSRQWLTGGLVATPSLYPDIHVTLCVCCYWSLLLLHHLLSSCLSFCACAVLIPVTDHWMTSDVCCHICAILSLLLSCIRVSAADWTLWTLFCNRSMNFSRLRIQLLCPSLPSEPQLTDCSRCRCCSICRHWVLSSCAVCALCCLPASRLSHHQTHLLSLQQSPRCCFSFMLCLS